MISSAFTVNGNANPAAHIVAYGSTVNLALLSTSGANSIVWDIMSCSMPGDSLPAITRAGSPPGATASFAIPADTGDDNGRSYIVRCTVSTELANSSGARQTSVSYGVVGAANVRGILPVCPDERGYRHATHGWAPEINEALKNTATAGPAGTGSDLNKDPITVAAITNVTATGLARVIDGVLCDSPSMRIGLLNQTNGADNGIYNPAVGAWSRTSDFNTADEMIPGCGGLISFGAVYGNGSWTLTTSAAITVGTTVLDFKIEPFVNSAGQDAKALTVTSGVPAYTKITSAHIDANTILLSKLTTGGAPDSGKIPTVNGSGVLVLSNPAVTGVTPVTESGTSLSSTATLKGQWVDVISGGFKFHAKVPRGSAKCLVDSNQATPLSVNTSVGGLSGTRLLRKNDVYYLGAQTTSSQNGPYRVVSVAGSTATGSKLTNLEVFFAANGLYFEIMEGTYGASIYKFQGSNGSLAAAVLMPAISHSFLKFDELPIDEFVIPSDDITAVTGNWYPMLRRAQEAGLQREADIQFGKSHDYRFTQRPVCWTLSKLIGRHIPQASSVTQMGRILIDGCGGFLAVFAGDTYESVTYDAGQQGALRLSNLNVVGVNGSDPVFHYGARARSLVQIENCCFQQFYGHGLEVDTTGTGGNSNSSSVVNTTWTTCGRSAVYISGGDANNIVFMNCRGTNYGQHDITAIEYDAVNGYPSLTAALNPALTLNSDLRSIGSTGAPAITLTGTLAYGATLVPRIRVWIDGVGAGTARGQATFSVSYDGTTTPAHSAVTTAATYALDGAATGITLNFDTGVYATTQIWRGSIFPGDDWGVINKSFLGCTFINCEFSSGHLGGIYDAGSFTEYIKPYTEGGTLSDVTACGVRAGNLALRPGGNATRLPLDRCQSTNSYASSGHVYDNGTFAAAVGDGAEISSMGLTGATSSTRYSWRVGTGGNSNRLIESYTTGSTSTNQWKTVAGHALGVHCIGFERGFFFSSTGPRYHTITRASLPATGVPITTGGAASGIDGPWPVGSRAKNSTPGACALEFEVLTNSGSASYNLTWGAIPHPSPSPVLLLTGNQTRIVTDGGLFVMPDTTTLGATVITVGTTSALQNDRIKWEIGVQAHNVTIDGIVITAGQKVTGYSRFNAGAWVTKLWVVL
jgi:hypothetical protein